MRLFQRWRREPEHQTPVPRFIKESDAASNQYETLSRRKKEAEHVLANAALVGEQLPEVEEAITSIDACAAALQKQQQRRVEELKQYFAFTRPTVAATATVLEESTVLLDLSIGGVGIDAREATEVIATAYALYVHEPRALPCTYDHVIEQTGTGPCPRRRWVHTGGAGYERHARLESNTPHPIADSMACLRRLDERSPLTISFAIDVAGYEALINRRGER